MSPTPRASTNAAIGASLKERARPAPERALTPRVHAPLASLLHVRLLREVHEVDHRLRGQELERVQQLNLRQPSHPTRALGSTHRAPCSRGTRAPPRVSRLPGAAPRAPSTKSRHGCHGQPRAPPAPSAGTPAARAVAHVSFATPARRRAVSGARAPPSSLSLRSRDQRPCAPLQPRHSAATHAHTYTRRPQQASLAHADVWQRLARLVRGRTVAMSFACSSW